MFGAKKLKLLVIGNSKRARCFNDKKFMPVTYNGNKKDCLKSELIENGFAH